MPHDLIEEQVELLERALTRGPQYGAAIPSLPGLSLFVSGAHRLASLLVADRSGPLWRAVLALKRPERLSDVATAWRRMVEESELEVHAAVRQQPAMPWYATRLEPGSEPRAAQLQEWASSLPWAWVERRARQLAAANR